MGRVVVGLTLAILVMTPFLPADPGPSTKPTTQLATTAPTTRPNPWQQPAALIATLENGCRAEFFAVGDAKTNLWWSPDGSPTTLRYPKDNLLEMYAQKVRPNKRYLVLISRIKAPNGDWRVRLDDGGQYKLRGADGYTDIVAHIVQVEPGVATVFHRYRFASQKPVAVALTPGEGGQWDPNATAEADIEGVGRFRLSAPAKDGEGSTIRVERPGPNTGAVIAYVRTTNLQGDTDDISFPWTRNTAILQSDWPPEKLKRIEMEIVRYDAWIEFRNISLDPGVRTVIETVTSHPRK